MPLQNISTVVVYDYLYDSAGKPIVGAPVRCLLNYIQATVNSPAVTVGPNQQSTVTDNTGYYQFSLVPNASLAPTGTLYQIATPFTSMDISVPAGAGPYQAPSLIVGSVGSLSSPATVITGPLTVQAGGLTVQAGGLTVQAGAVSLPAASLGVAALTGVLPIANGGTGSASQNFVDLTTNQTAAGAKTFSGSLVGNGGATIRPGLASQVGMIVQGQPSQTADFLQVMTNTTVVLMKVDSTGAMTFGGHFLAASGQPTLGALQANITAQSISGSNDVRGIVTITTGAVGPAVNSIVAVLTFANAFLTVPVITVTDQGTSAVTNSFVVRSVSTTGFSFAVSGGGITLAANTTYNIGYQVMG